jgi:hypothetical protein
MQDSRGKAAYAEWKQLAKQDQATADKFYAANQAAIANVEAAKHAFDELNTTKLPTIAQLKRDWATLDAEKKTIYSGFNATKKERSDLIILKANVEQLLNIKLPSYDAESEPLQEQSNEPQNEQSHELKPAPTPENAKPTRNKKLSSER